MRPAPAPVFQAPQTARPQPAPSDRWGSLFVAVAVAFASAGLVAGFGVSVTLLSILGFGTALAGLRYPALGLLGIGVLTTIDPLTRVYLMSGGLFRWNTFNYLLILLMVLFYPKVLRIRDASTLILIAFILLMVVHLTFTPAVEVGMYNVLNVLAAAGLLICHLRVEKDANILYWLAIVNGGVAAVGGMVYFLQISTLPEMNKNAWSAFPLTALFSICLAFPFARAGWRGQAALTALALINSLWVFFSGSRGAMLICIVCLGYMFLTMRSFMQRFWTVAAASAGAAGMLAVFAAQGEFAVHRIEKLFDDGRELDSRTSGRSDLALAGLHLFRQNPFGVGTGGFGRSYAGLLDNELALTGQEKLAHSAWIKTMVENGVFGLLALAAYVGSFAWVGFRRRKQGFFALGLLVTFVIASAFFSREFQSKGLWYMAAGFIAMSEYGCLAGSPVQARRKEAAGKRQLHPRAPRLTRGPSATIPGSNQVPRPARHLVIP
ncbi:MAG TPA: O-antigen ligase family protein [Bryobacteraceae bacterium]|nr:O-antigen ligase family protein [Bryobacteraceae bacterium]